MLDAQVNSNVILALHNVHSSTFKLAEPEYPSYVVR